MKLKGTLPSVDDLRTLADHGFTTVTIANRYDVNSSTIRKLAKLWPDIYEKLLANSKEKTKRSMFARYAGKNW